MNSVPAIEARDLTRRFGDFVAVDGLDLSIPRGEVFGFLGANGAGKTTAIRMLIGLLEPSSGEASVAGFDVGLQPMEVRRRVGYMSQRFSLYEDLTVRENVELYGALYGLSRATIRDRMNGMLVRVDATALRDRLVRELPLGSRQQLAFAVALLHEPEVLFLDEPTGGVDPITRRRFWEEIYRTAAGGTTVLVTTHYLDEAEYCDRISIMVDGKVAALGTPTEVRASLGATTLDQVFLALTRPGEP